MLSKSSLALVLAGVLLLVAPGCGDGRPSLVLVEGTLTLDGDPLAGAIIGFTPIENDDYQRSSRAQSDASGKFKVGTYDKEDGLPVGKYKVTVEKMEYVGELPEGFNEEDPAASSVPVKMQSAVPLKYSDPAQTDLIVEVTSEGLQPATIALSSDGGGGQVMEIGSGGADDP